MLLEKQTFQEFVDEKDMSLGRAKRKKNMEKNIQKRAIVLRAIYLLGDYELHN